MNLGDSGRCVRREEEGVDGVTRWLALLYISLLSIHRYNVVITTFPLVCAPRCPISILAASVLYNLLPAFTGPVLEAVGIPRVRVLDGGPTLLGVGTCWVGSPRVWW